MKGVSGLKAGHSKVIYFITDALGSVRDIVRGTDGAVLQSYEYTENGEKTVTLDGGIQNWKTWVGGHSVQDETADTDLYLMGHRWYSASAGGRFLSRDPIGFAGGMNLYSYSANSPVDMVDPEGLDPLGAGYNPNTYNPYERSHILSEKQRADAQARWEVTANTVTFAAGAAVPDPSDIILAGVFFGITKGAVAAGKYRKSGGHHVHAKAAFKGHPCYNAGEALSLSQDAMRLKGWSHQAMTNRQRELFKSISDGNLPNTLTAHTSIAVEALVAGGATKAEARSLVAASLRNLRDQGVYMPMNIPWYGGSIGTYR